MRSYFVILAIAAVHVGSMAAQSPAREPTHPDATAAAVVSPEQFRSFRWIEGRWRGSGTGALSTVPTFYEEYAFLDDSTVRLRTYRDSSFTTVTDSSWLMLRGGSMHGRSANGNAGVVTRFAGDSIQFGPPYRTLYLRLSRDLWRAIFPPRTSGGVPPYYELRRIGRAR